MAAVVETVEPSAADSGAVLAWRYDPWRERPWVAGTAAVAALALCALVLSSGEHPLVAAGLCLFCVAAFSPALTPVEMRLDETGVARRAAWGWERREFTAIRRVVDLPSGVFVSPYPRRHWLDAQRGLSLPMPASERPRLAAEIRRRVADHDA